MRSQRCVKIILEGINPTMMPLWSYPDIIMLLLLDEVSIPRNWYFDNWIALKFDRRFGSSAAEVPVKFQNYRTILNTNLAASRNRMVRRLIEIENRAQGDNHNPRSATICERLPRL